MVLSGKSGIFLSNIRNLLGSIALVSDRRRWKRKPQVEIIRQDKLRQEYINLSPAIKTSQQISKLSGNVAMNAIQSLDTDRNTLEKEEFQVDLQCKRKCNVPPRKEILQTPHIKVQQFKKQREKIGGLQIVGQTYEVLPVQMLNLQKSSSATSRKQHKRRSRALWHSWS